MVKMITWQLVLIIVFKTKLYINLPLRHFEKKLLQKCHGSNILKMPYSLFKGKCYAINRGNAML